MNLIFTMHALDKIERRKLTKEDVVEVVRFPAKILKKHGKYYFQKAIPQGTLEVVCEKTESNLNVITLYFI